MKTISAVLPLRRATPGPTRILATLLPAIALAGLAAGPVVHAQSWSTSGSGNWTTAANWNPEATPTAGNPADITNGTLGDPTVVNLNGGETGSVGQLTIGAFDTLNANYNSTLRLSGPVSNAGSIVAYGGSGVNTIIDIDSSVLLQGTGTLTLATASGGGAAYLRGAGTLTNESTILGSGYIGGDGGPLVNQSGGVINANVSGQVLTIQSTGAITNSSLLEATNGGVLNINGNTIANGGGTITASGAGSLVQLYGNVTIQGGTLTTVGGGSLGTVAGYNATLDGSTLAGGVTISTGTTYTGNGNSTTYLDGTITDNGNLMIIGGSGVNANLEASSATTLQGTGTVTLVTNSGGGEAYLRGGGTLTNALTIQGAGYIGGDNGGVVNQASGIIDANASGQTLELSGYGGLTNAGLVEATGGGNLFINGGTVNNAGGTLSASGAGSSVQLGGAATVQGGTLTTTGGASFSTASNQTATLDGSTSAGSVTVSTGSTYTGTLNSVTYVTGNLIDNGNIQINGGSGANTDLWVSGGATLQGTGTVTLATAPGGGQAYVRGTGPLTNELTIQGAGYIGGDGGAVINQAGAVIDANTTSQALTIQSTGAFTNAGTLEATNGGVLNVNGGVVNNSGGLISASGAPGGDASTVQLYGNTTIQGGTLTTTAGGVMVTAANNTVYLDGSTGAGAVTLSAGSTYTGQLGSETNLYGTFNNKGLIQINAGNGSNTYLGFGSPNTILQGGGTVNLSVSTGGGNAYLYQTSGGYTLTNVDNTIQGAGQIGDNGLTYINGASATVDANATGQTLIFQSTGLVTNNNLLEATNGGALAFNGTQVLNAGANITANGAGSSVQLIGNANIQGGTLNAINGGTFEVNQSQSAYLDGSTSGPITLNGTYTANLSSATYVAGTINNNGAIQINAGAGSNTSLIANSPTLTLQGGGTVTLSVASGGGTAYIYQAVGGETLVNVDNTIQGAGLIGDNGLAIDNEAGGTFNANATGQTLLFQSASSITNQNLLEATNGGNLAFNGEQVQNSGANITANGAGSSVQFVGSTTVHGGTLNALNGGTVQVNQGQTVYLDGSTAGAITLNGDFTGSLGSATYLAGTFNNNNTIQINGGSGSNTDLIVNSSNVILQGGGTLTLAVGSGGGNAYLYQAVGGETLTNVNNTIQGSGIVGNNGLAITNEAGGTINANATGQVLNFDGAGLVTNQNLIEATNGGLVQFTGTTINNHTGTILASGTGSTVLFLDSATVQGGTLTTASGGSMGTAYGNTAYLDGSTAAGAVTISTGSTYAAATNSTTGLLGTINNQGNLQLNGGSGGNGYFEADTLNLTLEGGGTLTLVDAGGGGNTYLYQAVGGTTLTNVDNTIQGAGVIGLNGLSILNEAAGTLLANAAGQTLTFNGGGSLTNNGTLQANAGSSLVMATNSALTNFSGNTLTGGTYVVNGSTVGGNGSLYLNLGTNTGGEIVNNAAKIVVNGPNANTFFVDANGNAALTNLASNSTATSSLTIEGGYTLTTPGDFSNAGKVIVGGGSGFTIGAGGANTYTQTGATGSTWIQAGGTLDAAVVNLQGGTMRVDGTVDPQGPEDIFYGALLEGTGLLEVPGITNDGTVVLGDSETSPGLLTVDGDYTQKSDGALFEGIDGALAGDNGIFDVNGNVILGDGSPASGGALDISILDGFDPTYDEIFNLITYTGSETGAFTSIDTTFDPGDWIVNYDYLNPNNGATEVVLEFTGNMPQQGPSVPDASSAWVLLVAGMFGLVLIKRSLKRAA